MSPVVTSTDRYLTRASAPAQWIDRSDPVIHHPLGLDAPGPLSAPELRRYTRDGYVVLPAVFSTEECQLLVAEVDRFGAAAAADDSTVIHEPDGEAVRSLFALHRRDGLLSAFCHDPRLVRRAEQVLYSKSWIHQSRVNRKAAFDGREFGWHSDFETWHAEDGLSDMRALSIMVALTDNLAANGPLLVIPGSHRTFVPCPGATPDQNWRSSLRRQEYGVPDRGAITRLAADGGVEAVVARAGSVVLFDCNLLHASAGNLTPVPRTNVFVVYASGENQLVTPFAGSAPRPWFLCDRERPEARR